MLRAIVTILAFALTVSFGTPQASAQSPTQAQSVIEDLLKFPAPTPQNLTEGRPGNVKFTWDSPPPDDTPLDVLGLYWSQIDDAIKAKASAQTRSRLLEACVQKPELTASLLKILPQTPEAQDTIKQIYDANADRLSENWRDEVKKYLKLNTKYFRDELVADALAAADDSEGGYVGKEDDLERLATLDWPKAEPILKKYAANPMPRRAVLAKTLLYRHYGLQDPDGAALFTDLKGIVENRKVLGYCRDRAAEALLSSEWVGRDEWFLKLFNDPTLRGLHDGMYLRHPLVDLVGGNPDHWIPIVTSMIGRPDRAVHDNAVECLIQFQLRSARKDALTPLLPWLLDPKWSSARDRLRLIQSVDELDMRDSVPGLIAVLNQKVDEAERAYAANSLIHFRDAKAIPDLRRGMPSIVDAHYRRMFISALITAGGLPDQEAATDIEAYAVLASTKEGAESLEKADYSWPKVPLPVPVSVGQYLAEREAPSEGTMRILLSRATDLDSSNVALAGLLRDIVHRWPTGVGDRDIADRIRRGDASPRSIAYALRRRETFTKNCADQIQAGGVGVSAGIFAVLSGDKQREIAVLQGNDTAAIAAVLAGSRLIREPLPLDVVARHYTSGEPQLVRVAAAYLTAEDSPRAREIFSSKSKGLVIVGARQGGGDPGHHSYTDFDKREGELLSLMSGEGASDEVYALLTAGYWGNGGQTVIARAGDSFTITFYDDAARRYRRTLKREEFDQLKSFVQSEKVDDLAPLSQMVFDGMQYEYVHLTKTQGRRVFMNNPGDSDSGGSVYDRLCGLFYRLLGAERMAVEYPALRKLPGFEVLVADERFHVMGFWKDGATERFRIYPGRDRGSAAMAFSNLGLAQVARVPKAENPIWVTIGGGAMSVVPAPELYPPENPNSVVPAEFEKENEQRQRFSLAMLSRGTVAYRVGEIHDKSGFWKFEPGKAPKLLVAGDVLSPSISSDGNWALLAMLPKKRASWAEPNVLVRVNLSSDEVLPVSVPEADTLEPVAYVAEQNRFLAYRAKDMPTDSRKPVGPDSPEYWLIDPSTGKGEITSAEIRPLTHVGARRLQAAGKEGEYWSAIPGDKGDGTDIGLFDAKALKFMPLMHVPELKFNSQALWIDQSGKSAYIVYNSHLLRLSIEGSGGPQSAARLVP